MQLLAGGLVQQCMGACTRVAAAGSRLQAAALATLPLGEWMRAGKLTQALCLGLCLSNRKIVEDNSILEQRQTWKGLAYSWNTHAHVQVNVA